MARIQDLERWIKKFKAGHGLVTLIDQMPIVFNLEQLKINHAELLTPNFRQSLSGFIIIYVDWEYEGIPCPRNIPEKIDGVS